MSDSLLAAPPLADPAAETVGDGFVDRRSGDASSTLGRERRQFTNSHEGLSAEAAELARAIDAYKARHRRRFIDFEELLGVVKSLGYSR
ncbi:hypothetical protein [Botrimarina sp.]|uniref:hypothetical protein n=1 Tax=Botrimarina sp. TaxID=2795802 RepID=UPI0032EC5FCF